MQVRSYQPHDQCPRCGVQGEDNVHVLKCPAATESWHRHQSALQLELRKLHTAPELANAILRNLNAWRSGTQPYFPSTNRWGERDAVQAQNTLGWTNFAFGRWHRKWAAAQYSYLQAQDSKLSKRRWIVAIIHKLYMTAWDFWDHRNKVLHASSGPRATDETTQLDTTIRTEYALGPTGLQNLDSHLLSNPIDALLSSRASTKRQWVQSIQLSRRLALAQVATDEHQQLQRQQLLMQRWLLHPNT